MWEWDSLINYREWYSFIVYMRFESYPSLFAALVSRQYVDMSRIRIEGLLATFPKLVGIGKQHTYVETDNVRYVYQPMESLYLLLVTNKQSNILEDRDTLQLLSKLVSSSHSFFVTLLFLCILDFFVYRCHCSRFNFVGGHQLYFLLS